MEAATALVSYASKNRDLVVEVLNGLKPWFGADSKVRLSFWRDEEGILKGTLWHESIQKAFELIEIYVPMLSPEYFESEYIHLFETPWMLDTPGKIVIPVALKPIPCPEKLRYPKDYARYLRLQTFWHEGKAFSQRAGGGRLNFLKGLHAAIHDRLIKELFNA